MRSKSRLTSRALRRGVPLKTMCSRKGVTPETSGVSSREPVRTKKPRATERADGLVSPISCRPLGSVWVWKGTGNLLWARETASGLRADFERLGAERHDGEVAG